MLLHVIWLGEVNPLDSAQGAPIVDSATSADRVNERLAEKASGEGVSLVRQLRQALPLVGPDREALGLSHGSFSVPTSNGHELSGHGDLDEGVIGSAVDHLGPFDERPVPLVELKQLSPLLATADVDLAVHGTLQYGREVAEGVLHLFKVNRLTCEVFEVMHYDLFPIRHKHSNPVIFRILF